MASDTSLVFNLVARDRVSSAVGKLKEKFGEAATAISAGVAGAFAAGVAGTMDMSAASSKLQAQLGLGADKAAQLSKTAAQVYAKGWGENIDEVDEAIRGVYQQIGDVSQVKGGLKAVTSDVMALAQTFDQDLGGTTAAVGQMIKTGLAANAKDALDILTRGFQSGADKAGDLLDTMNEYGTQFRSLGINGKMATGLLSQGLKGGARDADLVADSLKEFNLRARDITSTAPAGFKALGLNAKQMANDIAAGGPRATHALQMTLDALRKYPDNANKASVAANLFGTQSEDMQKALLSLDPSSAVKALGKVSGAADQMAKTVGDNPSAALDRFKRSAQMKLTEVGGHFVQFAMRNQQAFKPLVAVLGVAAVALLAYTAAAKIYAIQQAFVTEGTLAYAVAQWAANSALLANPMTWVVVAIVALIAVIVLIATKTTWFQQIWHTSWGAITLAASATWNWIKRHWPLILGILTGPIGLAVGYVVQHWNGIVSFMTKLPGRIGKATVGMWDGIKQAFRETINWIIGGWNGLRFAIPSVDTHIPGVGRIGGTSFGVPQIPYLAKGGHILAGGMAVVGERGPEQVYLPRGATVQPLTRGGVGGHIVVEVRLPGESDLLRANRKLVRVYGRGSVQVAYGGTG